MLREVLFYGMIDDLRNLIKWRTRRDLNSSGLINLKTKANIYFIALLIYFNINNFTQNHLHLTVILSRYKYLDKIKPNKNRTQSKHINNYSNNTLNITVFFTVLNFVLVSQSFLRHIKHYK